MAPLVYASSLESVTRIASNPPDHPELAVEGPELPLVLYIARVPGSRDVFLTPIKPRDRIVTAEDVQSSLYYIHVNSPEDFELPQPSPTLTPPLPRRPAIVNTNTQHLPHSEPSEDLHRKPLLPRRPAASNQQPHPTKSLDTGFLRRQPSSSNGKAIVRKPISSIQSQSLLDENRRPDWPRLPPRPLPTPPDEDGSDLVSLHDQNVHLLKYTDHTGTPNPYEGHYLASVNPRLDTVTRPQPGSLTLIRRDPSTHEQWNVASIYDQPVHEVSSVALLTTNSGRQSRKEGAPLYLDVTNPSYAKFFERERAVGRASTGSSSSDFDPASAGIYRQRLYMPQSRYDQHSQGIAHARFGSTGSNEEFPATRAAVRGTVDTMTTSFPMPDRRSRGYTFHSPWGSTCEFHTGTTGRNLKCRHFLPSGRLVDMSELRFNLPTTTAARSTVNAAMVKSEKRGSYLQGMHHRIQPTNSSNEADDGGDWTPSMVLDEDGRIDLTLGREKAGGGFGGRQAKLGKLIVEPEGLKMLDLLVAANVGLWWRAYERQREP